MKGKEVKKETKKQKSDQPGNKGQSDYQREKNSKSDSGIQQFSDKLFPLSVLSPSNINAQTLLTTCNFISPTYFSHTNSEFLFCLILAFPIP